MSDNSFEIPQRIKDNVAYGSRIWPLIKEELRFCGAGASDQFKKDFATNVIVLLRDKGLINKIRLNELLPEPTDSSANG